MHELVREIEIEIEIFVATYSLIYDIYVKCDVLCSLFAVPLLIKHPHWPLAISRWAVS